jgi:hypothetical protein
MFVGRVLIGAVCSTTSAPYVVPVSPLFQSQRFLLFARHGRGVTDRVVRILHAFEPPFLDFCQIPYFFLFLLRRF